MSRTQTIISGKCSWVGADNARTVIEAMPPDLHDKVIVPQVGRGERQRDETLQAETAREILGYLSRYHFASRRHVILALLWESGIRIGAATSIDLWDVHLDDGYIELFHRPDDGTTLKNGKSGERPIAITEELAELLGEYVENTRIESVDDYGREPLVTSQYGRLRRSSYRRIVYDTRAPCFRGKALSGLRRQSGSEVLRGREPARDSAREHHALPDGGRAD